ncbi:DMT family transporter [Methylobrevis pamukkalensis]|uniref:Aromatic amino acid exporter YddG n=1 Tax=Methylobrevis pamukkalensis TaxID=1439726 RepID=A0A1E3H8J0_9HYPH|nr:EamA family transporter [Methylobrevis pamukkalensis]ODN72640.1 Aromatic amino acid exporter YddG [Methylobrevis pamukkalensis]
MHADRRRRATLVGLTAVLMWSLLGLFAAGSGAVPPFLLNALCFGLSGLGACLWLAVSGRGFSALRQPAKVWVLGVVGLFGFHALYFTAIRNAPPVEANLINYLWPLLIVLFSGLLPGERLRWHHLAGVAVGFIGAALLITRGGGLALSGEHAFGYGAAIASALTWSSYSVLSRRLPQVPSEAVAGFCLATGVLSLACHLALETTVLPEGVFQWSMVLALAVFPVGLAFFVWDHGVKHGDIQVLGASAYAAPVLSTLVLILAGYGAFSVEVAAACAFVTGGALLASKDLLFGGKAGPAGDGQPGADGSQPSGAISKPEN